MISYSQNFEDVILQRVFHSCTQGRYLDIGGYDPVIDSVTKHFYDRGWSGVNVEPVLRFHQKFEKQRPRDWNINMACGAAMGSIEFHEWGDSGLSTYVETFDPKAVEEFGLQRSTRTVPMTTLAEIARQRWPQLGHLRRQLRVVGRQAVQPFGLRDTIHVVKLGLLARAAPVRLQ
jgi:FkbM family methyltransferase